MPKEKESFDLERIRNDNGLWMRLAMQESDGSVSDVFPGAENPFNKDGVAAMARVQRLAEQGKLYIRENAR